MAFGISLTSNAAEVAGRFAKLPGEMDKAEHDAVAQAARVVLKRVGQHFTGYTNTAAAASLSSVGLVRRRSGHLAQSANASTPEKDGSGWRAFVGFGSGPAGRYAKTIEEGKTFTAKGQVMAIPIGAALTPGGSARFAGPRDFPQGFWGRSVRGALLFFARVGGVLQPLFIGRRIVTVPAFRPLQRSLDASRGEIGRIFQRESEEAIRRALGSGMV
jgi:hypothetical protein